MSFHNVLIRLRTAANESQPGRMGMAQVTRRDLQDLLTDFDRIDALMRQQNAELAALREDRDSHQRCAIQAMTELAALREQKPVATFTAERLIGRAGEWGLSIDDGDWMERCRQQGGEFKLYAAPLLSDKPGAYDFGAPMAKVLAQFGLSGTESEELASELAIALIPHLMQWAEDSDRPSAQAALKWIVRNYPNPDLSHVDYRVEACRHAESALNTLTAEVAPVYGSYTTTPGESVAGIALRQLKDESRWVEIRDLNAQAFPAILAHEYYPVGTVLRMPAKAGE